MASVISQIIGQSPPQLSGQTTVRVDPALGSSVLRYALASPPDMLHARLMLNTSSASAGQLTIAGGVSDSGVSVWQLKLDVTSQTIALQVEDAEVSASLPGALDWHSIEVGLDAGSDTASLRVNGVERGSVNVAIEPTHEAWLGGVFASTDWAGTIDMDHWVLSDEPIGVALSPPTHDHGGDPRRWLVVYNRSDTDSCAWVETYRDRRSIPYANLCGLGLPTTETVSAADYEAMRQQVTAYLDDNHLRGQIVGVLLGYRVPGYADVAGQGALTPIMSYLATDDTHGLPVVNPLYQSEITDRPTASDYGSARLTGRIDAPTLAEAIALIDRADDLASQPLAHDQGGHVLIDINPDHPNVGPVYTQPVADWVVGDLTRLRLPATVYDSQPPISVSSDAVVWGWRDAAPPSGFFESPAGRRAICLQFDPEPEPAVTVRDPGTSDWLSTAIQVGYAFSAAPSRAYSLSSLPLPHLMFGALRAGWTAAEAWLVAQPFLRDGLQIVGDPLMPINFPMAGYDVFGPAPRLDLIDFDQPLATLHAGVREYALSDGEIPASGEGARYLVRRRDDHGRSDHASAAVFTVIEAGQPTRPALPAWPATDDWPVLPRDGQLKPAAFWPTSLRGQGIDSVQLVGQVGSEDPTILMSTAPTTGQRRIVFQIDRPAEPTRYRFVITQGAATFETPWSSEVEPADLSSQLLTVLETSS